MPETELPDEFENQEAMEAVVNKVHADIQAERAAREVVEKPEVAETPAEETPTETEHVSSDDHSAEVIPAATPVSSEGQAATPPKKAQSWLDADLRTLATAIGISDEALGKFSTRQDLEAAMDVIDARAVEAGRLQLAAQAAPAKAEKPPVPPPPVVEPPKVEKPTSDESSFLMSDEFDDGVVKPHNEFVKATDARIKALEAKLNQYEQEENRRASAALIQRFTGLVDSLGHSDLFGTPGKRTAEEQERLAKAWDQHRAHVMGLHKDGKAADTSKPFVERAVYALFGKELTAKGKKSVVEGLKQQSNKRMGGPSNKPMRETSTGVLEPKKNPAVMADLKAEFAAREAGTFEG